MFHHAARIATARIGDFAQPLYPYLTRVATALLEPQQPLPPVSHDTTAPARALVAFKEVFARYEAEIEAIRKHRGMTHHQKAAAILALRERQQIEARAARRQVLEEARRQRQAGRARLRAILEKPPKI